MRVPELYPIISRDLYWENKVHTLKRSILIKKIHTNEMTNRLQAARCLK